MKQNRTKELLAGLKTSAQQFRTSEEFTNYLQTMSQFHAYSWGNTMLIHMQRPTASLVAGFRQWQTRHKRRVSKGEKAIWILAPMTYKKKEEDTDGNEKEMTGVCFRSVAVFDVSQTDGEPLETLDMSIENGRPELLAKLEAYCQEHEIAIEYKTMGSETGGYSSGGSLIAINEDKNTTERAVTMVHELAHIFMHQRDTKGTTSTELRELEAESVTFVVCHGLGLHHDRSVKYVASWAREHDLTASLKGIHKMSKDILQAIN